MLLAGAAAGTLLINWAAPESLQGGHPCTQLTGNTGRGRALQAALAPSPIIAAPIGWNPESLARGYSRVGSKLD